MSDPFDLTRFVTAQESKYQAALGEITSGHKTSHWMWFIFPQFRGLGSSPMSAYFAIQSVDEARAYLGHGVLGPRLRECAQAALGVRDKSALEIFGSPDDMKLKSCATLFAMVTEKGSVFEKLLEAYFGGERCEKTLRLMQ